MSRPPAAGVGAGTAPGPRAWFRPGLKMPSIMRFSPPFRNWHFWMIQGLVIFIAGAHAIIETSTAFQNGELVLMLPTAFFLVPVVYAALTFGLAGAMPTVLWAAILSLYSIFVGHHGLDRLGEVFEILIVGVVAYLVGREVDRVKRTQRQAETTAMELKTSRMRYHSIFESSPVAILVFDGKGVIMEANPAATVLFKKDAAALEGLSVTALLGPAEARKILEVPARGGRAPGPVRLKSAEGADIYLEPMMNELSDGQGGLVTEVLFRDITQEHGRQTGMEAYTAYVTQAQEKERQRIARELHDETIQSLVLLCRRLDTARDACEASASPLRDTIQAARLTAEATVKGLRDITKALRPSVLDDLGLVTSIRRLLTDFTERSGVTGKFKLAGEERRLGEDVELGLYRIAQEALWNVEYHAAASRVALTVTIAAREARLEVTDNGKGFVMTSTPDDLMATGHLGLISMQERTKLLGGTMTIMTGPGKGTVVLVAIPVAEPAGEP